MWAATARRPRASSVGAARQPSTPTPRNAVADRPRRAGLTEAVWTVARLGCGADTATATPALDHVGDYADSLSRGEVESGSGPRLGRLRLQTPTARVTSPNTDPRASTPGPATGSI